MMLSQRGDSRSQRPDTADVADRPFVTAASLGDVVIKLGKIGFRRRAKK
jgi:hypothetical protein